MIGIPTKSDAIKIDPDYAETVLVEDLNNKLSMLNCVFSGTFPHNHVAEAYRDSGKIKSMPNDPADLHPSTQSRLIRGLFRWLSPHLLPRGVDGLLKPELVRDHFTREITDFKRVLQEAQGFLDHETGVITINLDKAFSDCDFSIIEMDIQNPYRAANQLLDEFYQEITDSFNSEPTKIGKIASMMATARNYEDSAKYDRVKSGLSIRHNNSSIWNIENQQDHPIYELVKTNKDISKKSDISLSFDERCFTHSDNNHKIMIPAYAVISDKDRFSHCGLWHRENLRQIVYQAIDRKSVVAINGVEYEKVNIVVSDKIVDGFRSDNPSFQEIANLFGRPIEQPGCQIIYPETWAKMEVDLIQDYREGDTIARNKLIYIYNCDTSYGNPSIKKAYEQLDYSLKIEKLSY